MSNTILKELDDGVLKLTLNRPERKNAFNIEQWAAFADAIAADTEMSRADAMVLAMSLTGMAQMSARNWVTLGTTVGQEEAARLVGQLAWRGLGGFPRSRPADGSAAEAASGESSAPA